MTPSPNTPIVRRNPHDTYYGESKKKAFDWSLSSNLFSTQSTNFSSTFYGTLSRSRTQKGMTQQSYSGLTNVRKGSTLVWDKEAKLLRLFQHGRKSVPKISRIEPE